MRPKILMMMKMVFLMNLINALLVLSDGFQRKKMMLKVMVVRTLIPTETDLLTKQTIVQMSIIQIKKTSTAMA